jgi:hypothetical protein
MINITAYNNLGCKLQCNVNNSIVPLLVTHIDNELIEYIVEHIQCSIFFTNFCGIERKERYQVLGLFLNLKLWLKSLLRDNKYFLH